MKDFIVYLSVIFLVGVAFNIYSYENSGKNPVISTREITFVYTNPFAKNVFLKTSIDNWEKRYPFKKRKIEPWNGQWVLSFDIENPSYGSKFQLKKGTYKYKILADGYFTHDENAQQILIDKNGEKVSAFTIDDDKFAKVCSPIKIPKSKGMYRFFYWNYEAKNVYLTGSFNNYNPYSHPFEKKKEGYWEIDVELTPGTHYYQLVIDGDWVKDPMNPDYATGISPDPTAIYSRLIVND